MKISDLYEWFSSVFAEDREAASFFYRLSIEEAVHANLIKYQRRVAAQNMRLVEDVPFDLEAVNVTLERVEAVLSGRQPSLEEAVRLALEIENSAAEAHSAAVSARAIPAISGLLSSLSGFDSKHVEAVERFAGGRGLSCFSDRRRSEVPQTETSAPAAGTREPVEIEQETLQKIEQYFEWHRTMDFYEILGVRDYATGDEIKKAYRALAREFHPDAYANAAEEIQTKLGFIFSRLTEAYSTLTDPVKRKGYDMQNSKLRK